MAPRRRVVSGGSGLEGLGSREPASLVAVTAAVKLGAGSFSFYSAIWGSLPPSYFLP